MSMTASKIEAILFVSGEEMSVQKIQKALGNDISEEEVVEQIKKLQEAYQGRGVRIISKDGRVQMVSAPEYAEVIHALVRSHLTEELTPAALETLACIAYREPIAKQEIDELRGVNSIFSLRSLLMRGLIEKTKKNDDAQMNYYRVTLDFLKKLGVEKITDLPDYDVFSKNA
ncbi:MAG: SMC-Scp complex subunit ScpB [Candidatus Azambacteria bacterium]|nr:SMC-Scp complex subunit ScpB [Candidatus Azambacteria bacterium]